MGHAMADVPARPVFVEVFAKHAKTG